MRTAPRRLAEPAAAADVAREDAAVALPAAGAEQAADIAHQAVEAVFDRLRILDWAERIRADGSGSLLIARPPLDGHRPSYPSAVEAYRDIAEVIGAL